MIHAITLNRSQQHDRRGMTANSDEGTIRIWIRLSRLQRDILPSIRFRPEHYFLVILAIDSGTDVRVGVEFGRWECFEKVV